MPINRLLGLPNELGVEYGNTAVAKKPAAVIILHLRAGYNRKRETNGWQELSMDHHRQGHGRWASVVLQELAAHEAPFLVGKH